MTAARRRGLRPRSGTLGKQLLPYALVAPSVLTLCFLLLYPIGRVIYFSLWNNYMVVRRPTFVGLNNFHWLFQQQVFSLIFSNTVLFTVFSVLLHLLLGLALAVLLTSDIKPLWRTTFRGVLILPWLFTSVVVSLTWRLLLHPLGVFNTLLSQLGLMDLSQPVNWLGEQKLALPAIILINLWRGYPFAMLMLLAALQSIPKEQHEAAAVDGANCWARFRYVTIPNIKPVVASVALLDTIWNFRLFDLVYLTTGGGPLNSTHVLATFTYQLAFERFEIGKSSAVVVVILVLTSVLTLFYLRVRRE